jgi:hypothetical protein
MVDKNGKWQMAKLCEDEYFLTLAVMKNVIDYSLLESLSV